MRPDLKRQEYIHQKKRALAAEQEANREVEARLLRARVKEFFSAVYLKIRDRKNAQRHETPVWSK